MITLIIGKNSNLTQALSSHIPDCYVLSSRELSTDIDLLSPFKNQTINLIFNNFQTAIRLNETDNLTQYIENSINITANVLDYFKETQIRKIIYTSSSSVYGNNILCNESDEVKPLSLHAALKVSNEKLIEKYSQNRQIDYTVTRIFNMFGGNDVFSIISKIFIAYTQNEVLTIINNGNAIRDFIHIDYVVEVYSKLLTTTDIPLINIGSGHGTSIRHILDFLKNNHINLKTQTLSRDELKTSTADNAVMIALLGHHEFKKVEDYLLEQLTT
ncbi:MAG: NAD-dependent epimerase/dehydratase family protein [Sulfuricurvum sp.]